VTARISDEAVPLERLREDYKEAFEEWATEVNRLQTVSKCAPDDAPVVQEAEVRVEAAHRTYQDSRDRLADDIAGSVAGSRHDEES
jgi:hypothetical protein